MKEENTLRITAIILAAGFSRRMGQDKLLLPYRGKTLLAHTVELVAGMPFHQRLLVTTPARLAVTLLPPGVTPVLNQFPHLGQSESLRLGTQAAVGDAYLYFSADQPLLTRGAVEQLLAQAREGEIVYPVVNGRPSNPALFSANFRLELLAQQGDTGGREVRKAHPELCREWVAPDPGFFLDIDTMEDYKSLQKQ